MEQITKLSEELTQRQEMQNGIFYLFGKIFAIDYADI